MSCDEHDASTTYYIKGNDTYYSAGVVANLSSFSLNSTSSASSLSDSSSQRSDSSTTSSSSVSDSCDSCCLPRHPVLSESSRKFTCPFDKTTTKQERQNYSVEVPPELRQNPRRTVKSNITRSGCPPPLVRQSERKHNFVDNLVDSATYIVEAIWPTSSVTCRSEGGAAGVLRLRTFIQETLRRSRTSYSTLQVALYYLILIKPHVPKHDFTMEQPEDSHSSRVIQCGRRMFLAALILASKYLQDRNFSARAWSKISGLQAQEINQNEIVFLHAVKWNLHITDETYSRWTECMLRFTPTLLPSLSLGGYKGYEHQREQFSRFICKLNPRLDNIDVLSEAVTTDEASPDLRAQSIYGTETCAGFDCEAAAAVKPKHFDAPLVMEPAPIVPTVTPARCVPALGLLPTPRLTHQASGFVTPAVGATSNLLGKGPSMGYVVAQAMNTFTAQTADRWPVSSSSSVHAHQVARRSSLAATVSITSGSITSSPESMVSDSSQVSRSSSISSVSSLSGAPPTNMEVLARSVYAEKQGVENALTNPTIISEAYDTHFLQQKLNELSPESAYNGPVDRDVYDLPQTNQLDVEGEAARALQALQQCRDGQVPSSSVTVSRAGSKRSRSTSIDNLVQAQVRDILSSRHQVKEAVWSSNMLRPRVEGLCRQSTVPSMNSYGRKRVCYTADAVNNAVISSLHPVLGGVGGPGMWEGILD